jgi:beta-barrel assembly-enhancing protease
MVMTDRRPLALALALLLLAAGSFQPATAQTVSNPDLYDKSLQVAAEVAAHYGTWEDPEQLARVNRIGYELAQRSEYQKFPFTFGLVDLPVPNAFALPGGQIFVTRGMLEMGLDDDMLANVLGHEIAHVTGEHYLRMQRKAALMNVLGNLLVVGVVIGESQSNDRRNRTNEAPYDPRVGRDGGTNVVQGAAAASLVISELLLRSYSRDHEDQADQEGQRLAAAAGYDPDGARRVWELMNRRAPQTKQYGYWQTHPFADERIRSAEVRKTQWKVEARRPADDYRRRTQAVLTNYVAQKEPTPQQVAFVKDASLAAWPQGRAADGLRLEKLRELREEELARPALSRDYGAVIRSYREELAQVESMDPESELLATLRSDVAELARQRDGAYAKAAEVLAGGVYETSFLVSFLSNYPEAPEVPRVALALGDAYSRLGKPTEAVEQYLTASQAGPDSSEGRRARAGLRNLAPNLNALAALQQMAEQEKDPELKRLSAERLATVARAYDELANGAEYLRRFPEGEHAGAVMDRLNVLADNLYGEVVLYQRMGDPGQAIERINQILTHAPLSPAAEKLRDRAVLTAEKAG